MLKSLMAVMMAAQVMYWINVLIDYEMRERTIRKKKGVKSVSHLDY